jgi:thiol-disulfide isomerase/thioredoxin
MHKYLNTAFLSIIILSCADTGTPVYDDDKASIAPTTAIGDAYRGPVLVLDTVEIIDVSEPEANFNNENRPDIIESERIPDKEIKESDLYPPGPYSIELFGILPDLAFYDPWNKSWTRTSEYYKHKKNKVLLIVSSAGWCGPCQKEAAELVDMYDEYHDDGLEIAYTLLQSFELQDYIFVNPDQEEDDMFFMEQWKEIPFYYGGDKAIQYPLYADPGQALNNYVFGGYGIPFVILITTKDMGIRFVNQGYAPNVLENKILLSLYSDVPDLPFK